MQKEKEIKLTIAKLEAVLKKAELLSEKDRVYEAHIEPGELVIKLVR